MKTALIFSGQPRNFLFTYEYIKKNILDILQPDVFFHTWSDNLHSAAEHVDVDLIEYPNETQLINLLNPKLYKFQKNEYIFDKFDKEIRSKYSDPFIQYSMFYSMREAILLKKKYEKKNSFIYDLVIRIRFDFLAINKFDYSDFRKNKLNYYDLLKNKRVPCDWMFWSDSKTMDTLSECFLDLKRYSNSLVYFTGENILNQKAIEREITLNPIKKSGFILRDKYFKDFNSGNIFIKNITNRLFDTIKFLFFEYKYNFLRKSDLLLDFTKWKIESLIINRFRNLKKIQVKKNKKDYSVVFKKEINDNAIIRVYIFSYNKSKFIDETINRVLNSEKPHLIDLVVIDDNSNDNTLEIVFNHAKSKYFSFLKFNRNNGISYLRNFAISLTPESFKYIYFLDGDDYVHRSKISESIKILDRERNFDAAFSNLKNIYMDGRFEKTNLDKHLNYDDICKGATPPGPMSNIIYKRDLFNINKLYFDSNVNHLEDWDFLLSLTDCKYYLIKDCLLSVNLQSQDFYKDSILNQLNSRLYIINKKFLNIKNLDYQKNIITHLCIVYTIKTKKYLFLVKLIFLNFYLLMDISRYSSIRKTFRSLINLNINILFTVISIIKSKIKKNANNKSFN
tara:strand:+ start:1790 stop:3652 length:1863 start_codon:yes stop_codon:yes gene_type:complete